MISSSQKPLPTQQTQQTNIHVLSDIRTRDPKNLTAADLSLKPYGHRNRLQFYVRGFYTRPVNFENPRHFSTLMCVSVVATSTAHRGEAGGAAASGGIVQGVQTYILQIKISDLSPIEGNSMKYIRFFKLINFLTDGHYDSSPVWTKILPTPLIICL